MRVEGRVLVMVGLGLMLSRTYRVALIEEHDDPSGWAAFVLFWLPAAIFLGLAVTYVWPAVSRWWTEVRK